MNHFKIVLQFFKHRQLFAKFDKCEFWLISVIFLGHIISSEVVEVNKKRCK